MLNYIKPFFTSILSPRWFVLKNLPYGKKERNLLDLYLLETNRKCPIMILIHGGGWSAGDKSAYEGRAKRFALAGFHVASINYTLATDEDATTHWPAQISDVIKAIDFIKESATDYGIDPNQIFVGGDSAGGHLALWAGVHRPEIKAIINHFGPCDLTQLDIDHIMLNVPVLGRVKYEDNPELYQRFSPYFMMTKNYPPVMTLHGTKDDIVPYTQATWLDMKLKMVGVEHKLVTFDGGHEPSFLRWYKQVWLEMQGVWFALNHR